MDPEKYATRDVPNHVDNVEQVAVYPGDYGSGNIETGEWKVVVSADEGKLPSGFQDFTIIGPDVTPIRMTKSFMIYNQAEQSQIPGVPDPVLIIDSITVDDDYPWLTVTAKGKPVENISIPAHAPGQPPLGIQVDVTVDFAYSPEGKTALLTINSNDPDEPPTVFILVKIN